MTASARRKSAAKIQPAKARPAVRLAHGGEAAGATPVRDQHLMLEAAFSSPAERPYPVAVKAAIFVGAPTALWAGIIFVGSQILRMSGS
jgi:hypothetical protein